MKTLPITVIILTHRKDGLTFKAIESVSFAAEIIVIDNNSGIAWEEYLEKNPLVIVPHEQAITDFAAVRNQALQRASHEWVLFLDSDEQLLDSAYGELTALLSHPNAHGAVLHRSDIFLGKKLEYGEAGRQAMIRIGKKYFMKFHGATHEMAQIQGECVTTTIELLHYAHPSISEFIGDVSRYAQAVAREKTSSRLKNLVELVFFPPLKLLYGLIVQGGILDGWHGLVYAFCMSLHSLLVRIYRYELLAHTQARHT